MLQFNNPTGKSFFFFFNFSCGFLKITLPVLRVLSVKMFVFLSNPDESNSFTSLDFIRFSTTVQTHSIILYDTIIVLQ